MKGMKGVLWSALIFFFGSLFFIGAYALGVEMNRDSIGIASFFGFHEEIKSFPAIKRELDYYIGSYNDEDVLFLVDVYFINITLMIILIITYFLLRSLKIKKIEKLFNISKKGDWRFGVALYLAGAISILYHICTMGPVTTSRGWGSMVFILLNRYSSISLSVLFSIVFMMCIGAASFLLIGLCKEPDNG